MRVLTILCLSAVLCMADSKKAASRDVTLRQTLASGLADLAEWCHGKKLMPEGLELISDALKLDSAHARSMELQAKLKGDSAGTEADSREFASKKEAFGKRLAPLYRELWTQPHAKELDAAYDGFLVKSYAWDPKGQGPLVDAAWKAACANRAWEQAHRILSGMERLGSDPARAKALLECELKVAETEPVLKKASAHRMEYWMMLPKDWSVQKKYPVLVYVDGAGSNFNKALRKWGKSTKDVPYIVVTLQTFSSTNDLSGQAENYTYPKAMLDEFNTGDRMKFDEEGLLNVLEDLRKNYGAEDKIFITGYSGGGNLTWRMVFGHPEMVAAAAPACPNFATPGKLSLVAERETLPVKVFQGEKDKFLPSMLEDQWLRAKKTADENGWKNVSRVMLPDVAHSSCVEQVLEFFRPLALKK